MGLFSPFSGTAHSSLNLPEAYLAAGDLARARTTYEQLAALTTGRLSRGASYARRYYQLGLIAERQGDKGRARQQFQKFLEIWKDADPGLAEVADAKKRLARQPGAPPRLP